MKGLKCRFWLYTAKKQKGLSPLHCRILVNGKKIETSLGIKLKEEEWNEKKEVVKSNNSLHKSYNARLEKIISDFDQAVTTLLEREEEITSLALKNLIFPKYEIAAQCEPKVTTLKQLINDYLNAVKGNKDNAVATFKRYQTMCRRFAEYIHRELNVHDVELTRISLANLTGYEADLVKNDYDNNTVIRYVKGVKMLFKYAVDNEYLGYTPFSRHKSKKFIKKPILFLTEEELARLEAKDFNSPRLDFVKDFFLLQCYSGMSFADLCAFTKDSVKLVEDRNFIVRYRQKTKVPFIVPLLYKAELIFEKYNWKLPVKSNQKMNCYLKEIADICGFSLELTTHVGRKTFATLSLSKGVPIETVSKMVGHTNIKQTLDAYADVLTSKMIQDMAILEG